MCRLEFGRIRYGPNMTRRMIHGVGVGAAVGRLRRIGWKGGRLNRETELDESERKVMDVVWMKEVKKSKKRRLE